MSTIEGEKGKYEPAEVIEALKAALFISTKSKNKLESELHYNDYCKFFWIVKKDMYSSWPAEIQRQFDELKKPLHGAIRFLIWFGKSMLSNIEREVARQQKLSNRKVS